MPSSTYSGRLGLWVRMTVACLVLLVVTGALAAFEAAAVGVVSYGALSILLGFATTPFPTEAAALLAAVLAYLAVAAVVVAASRLERRDDFDGDVTQALVVYAGVALAAGSLALTFLAMDALGAPRWAFGVVIVLLLAGAYPMIGLLLGRENDPESDDPPWGTTDIETDEPLPWKRDDESESSFDSPSPAEVVRDVTDGLRTIGSGLWRVADAIGAEFGDAAIATRARLGTTGTVGVAALAILALGGVAVAARTRSAWALVLPLSAAFGALFALGHVADAVHTTRRDGAVVDDLAGDLGPAVDDERTRAVEARVARLAAAMDAPAPTVALRRSRTATAAVVGYRPTASTLVVTTTLLERLSDRELDAVLAHELAHVANRDAAVVTALSAPRIVAGRAFYRYGPNPVTALLAAVVAGTSRLCVAVVSRGREYAADDAAVAATGDPAALASALDRLDGASRPNEDLRGAAAPFSIVPPPWEEHPFFDRTRRFVSRRLLGTHPATEKRIERLRTLAGEAP